MYVVELVSFVLISMDFLCSHHRDSMLFAWVLEQIGLWRPYTVVAAWGQMTDPLVEEALLDVPLADQWSCRVSRRGPESEDE